MKPAEFTDNSPPPARDRDSRATGWLLLLFSALYLYPFVRVLWRICDEGTLVYGAQRVAEGALPYRDFFEVMGPGSFYWLGFFFKVFGTHWLVARGVLFLTGLAVVMLMYWLTRRLDQSRSAFLPAAFFLVISIPGFPGTNHHLDSNLFALLALVMFCLWQDRRRKAFLLLSGIVAGVTSCFLQQKGLFLFVALLVVTFISDHQAEERRKQILSHLGLLTVGFASVGCLVLLYFYAAGGFQDLLYANLIWPFSNYHKVNLVSYGFYLFESVKPAWEANYSRVFPAPAATVLCFINLIPLYLIYLLPVLLLSLIIACSVNKSMRCKMFNPKMLSYIITGLSLWLSELHRKDLLHLIYGSPLLLIVSFLLFKQIMAKKRLLYGIVIGFISIGFVTYGFVNASIATNANKKISTRVGNIYSFENDNALNFLLKNTKPGDPVFIYPYYPMYYFLANIKNPTRYSILVYQINTEKQFREAINDLEKARVKYVLWDTLVSGGNFSKWFPQYRQPEEDRMLLENYLDEHYDIVQEENNFKIMQRREN